MNPVLARFELECTPCVSDIKGNGEGWLVTRNDRPFALVYKKMENSENDTQLEISPVFQIDEGMEEEIKNNTAVWFGKVIEDEFFAEMKVFPQQED
ncbi:MAG: hypothetical protein K6G27_14185 [Lachnospiraceae bacterium]|nr:hypothetical protein [Lachnospiraceae bacterium]